MRNIRLSVTATVWLFAGSVNAYQFELGASYTEFENVDLSSYSIGGVYHFANVSDIDRPLKEAGFLGKSSNVGASYAKFDEVDGDGYALGGEAYFDMLYLSASYGTSEGRVNGIAETEQYGASIGVLPLSGLRLRLGFNKVETDTGGPGTQFSFDSEETFVSAKYVHQLDHQYSLSLGGGVSQFDDSNDTLVYGLGTEFFFNHQFSLGLNFSDSDGAVASAVSYFGTYFVTPGLGFSAGTTNQTGNDTWSLSVVGRF